MNEYMNDVIDYNANQQIIQNKISHYFIVIMLSLHTITTVKPINNTIILDTN